MPPYTAWVTMNEPVSSLQPRPSPLTDRPGPVPLNGYLVALV